METPFHTASILRANGHKTYFQPGDTFNQQNALGNVYRDIPVIQQSSPALTRQRWPTWRIVLLTVVSTLVTTYLSAPTVINYLYSMVSPDLRYLAEQSTLHAQNASNLKELWHAIALLVLRAPGREGFFDSYQDMQLLRSRPLKLADGTLANENNAVLVRIVDIRGRTHMMLLAVDTDENDDVRDAISSDGSWTSNRTPIQKWMIALETHVRREQKQRGEVEGVTLVYITRDTIGIGAFGPIQTDPATGELGGPGFPEDGNEKLAMMHCVSAGPRGWPPTLFAALQTIKHEPMPLPKVVDSEKISINITDKGDPDGIPRVMLKLREGGEWQELGRGDNKNAVRTRRGLGKGSGTGIMFIFEQQQDDGTWKEIARWDADAEKPRDDSAKERNGEGGKEH